MNCLNFIAFIQSRDILLSPSLHHYRIKPSLSSFFTFSALTTHPFPLAHFILTPYFYTKHLSPARPPPPLTAFPPPLLPL